MKKAVRYIAYYIAVPLLLLGAMLACSALLRLTDSADNLGAAMAATYFFLFLAAPAVAVLAVRLSVLPWVVDPFAAAELPLTLFAAMVVNVMGRGNTVGEALSKVHRSMANDGGEGYIFLAALFVFALVCSISLRRGKKRDKNESEI